MSIEKFELGQIVYVKNKQDKHWKVSHFAGMTENFRFSVDYFKDVALQGKGYEVYDMYLTVEEYESLGSVIPDKTPVLAWNSNDVFSKTIGFYDEEGGCLYNSMTGDRGGLSFENYEPIPQEDVPAWLSAAVSGLK